MESVHAALSIGEANPDLDCGVPASRNAQGDCSVLLKVLIALVLVGHGIGHSIGMVQMFKVATVNPAWHGDSWLLSGIAGPTATQVIGATVWSVAMIGFVLLGAMVVGWLPETYWTPLAVVASIASLAGVLLFPIAFPTMSTIGAVAVDLSVLVAVLWYHWTPSQLAS